jgi:hypothetical protein
MKIIRVEDPMMDVSEFTENIPKHKAVVMVYMMENCPHCLHLKPKWETVKHILKEDPKFNDVMMADIDSGASSLLPLPPVMGFPNIKVLKDDKLVEYNGMREVDPLLSFIRKTVTTPANKKSHKSRSRSTSNKSHKSRSRSASKRSKKSQKSQKNQKSKSQSALRGGKRKSKKTHKQ